MFIKSKKRQQNASKLVPKHEYTGWGDVPASSPAETKGNEILFEIKYYGRIISKKAHIPAPH